MLFHHACAVLSLLLISSFVEAHPVGSSAHEDHVERRSPLSAIGGTWYHADDHPARALFKRQALANGTMPAVGSDGACRVCVIPLSEEVEVLRHCISMCVDPSFFTRSVEQHVPGVRYTECDTDPCALVASVPECHERWAHPEHHSEHTGVLSKGCGRHLGGDLLVLRGVCGSRGYLERS